MWTAILIGIVAGLLLGLVLILGYSKDWID